jgi:AraC-like DNA-binding protein
MLQPGLNRAAAKRAVANPAKLELNTVGQRCIVAICREPEGGTATTSAPVHRVYFGRSLFGVEHSGGIHKVQALALPAGTTHRTLGPEGLAVVYLDARRFRFADAERLAQRFRGFVPGQDDPLELYADVLKIPAPRLDPRLDKAAMLLETGASVAAIARSVNLSESRLSHLFAERLGTPLRSWRGWFLLRQGNLHIFSGSSVTEAAHASGFADAAHLSRTHRNMLAISPTELARYRTRFVTDRLGVLDCDALRASHRSPRAVAATILGAYRR